MLKLFRHRKQKAFSFDNSVVLITGAAGALGSVIASHFAKRNARLALADRNTEGLQKVVDQLRKSGVEAKAFATDLLNDSELEALPARVENAFGEIDAFVSCAGVEFVAFMHTVTAAELDMQLSIHLRSPMLLTTRLLPRMLERKRGSLVFVSSMQGKLPTGAKAPYAAAKAGLIGFVHSLRRETEDTGVFVSVVTPGLVEGAGQGIRGIQGSSAHPDDIAGGAISPEQLADAVLRCIENNTPEMMVNPRNPLMLVAVNSVKPGWADAMLKRVGAFDFWTKVAKEISEK